MSLIDKIREAYDKFSKKSKLIENYRFFWDRASEERISKLGKPLSERIDIALYQMREAFAAQKLLPYVQKLLPIAQITEYLHSDYFQDRLSYDNQDEIREKLTRLFKLARIGASITSESEENSSIDRYVELLVQTNLRRIYSLNGNNTEIDRLHQLTTLILDDIEYITGKKLDDHRSFFEKMYQHKVSNQKNNTK